jgi:GrpB-like predicted nucleotidyltransferase (UPF0157 family)
MFQNIKTTKGAALERVNFLAPTAYQYEAANAFEHHARRLRQLLPDAEIIHIGSSAVPGAWSKGDLDILVRVSAGDFASSRQVLSRHLALNEGSTHDANFASFKDDRTQPPLGVQLVVAGGPYDDFEQFGAYLRDHPEMLEAYNALKKRHEGGAMTTYRAEKSEFIERVLEK